MRDEWERAMKRFSATRGETSHPVMAGLVPTIHELSAVAPKTWMPGSSPGMTQEKRGERESQPFKNSPAL
jgi:hypothetical protein